MPRYDERSDEYKAGVEDTLLRVFNTMYGLQKTIEDAAGEDLDPLVTAQLSHLQTDPFTISVHAIFKMWHEIIDDTETKRLFKISFLKRIRSTLLAQQPYVTKITHFAEMPEPRRWRGEKPPIGTKQLFELLVPPAPEEVQPEEEEETEE